MSSMVGQKKHAIKYTYTCAGVCLYKQFYEVDPSKSLQTHQHQPSPHFQPRVIPSCPDLLKCWLFSVSLVRKM